MIHVCYALYDKNGAYSRVAGAAICSLLENTKENVTVHLLHDNTLAEGNIEKFIALCKMYDASIVFYNVEIELGDLNEAVQREGLSTRFSPATFYRLALMRVIPQEIKKVIYLDCDTIVNMEIGELWDEEVGSNGIGAISEFSLTHGNMCPKAIIDVGTVKKERYFNAGVLVIDMDKYREHPNLIIEGLNLLRVHPEYDCLDQDVLNYYFSGEYRGLNKHYDIFPAAERLIGNQAIQKGIYHYAGSAADLFEPEDVYNVLFFNYYVKTPWFDGRTLINICRKSIEYIYNEFGMSFWRSVINRQVVFCSDKMTLSFFREKVNIRPDSVFVDICPEPRKVELSEAISYLEKHPDKSPVLAIVSPVYPQIKALLEKLELFEGQNFVNAKVISDAVSKKHYPWGAFVLKNI